MAVNRRMVDTGNCGVARSSRHGGLFHVTSNASCAAGDDMGAIYLIDQNGDRTAPPLLGNR